MKDFKKEIKEKAIQIVDDLNLKAVEIKIDKKDKSASVLLEDKKNDIKLWFDLWKHMEEITGDWNKYIFDLTNSKDLLIKYIQEEAEAYEHAYNIAVEYLEENGGF